MYNHRRKKLGRKDDNPLMTTLNDVLHAVSESVDRRKLLQLRRKLEAAIRTDLSAIQIDDPMTIRRQLVAHMQCEGASRGMIQSYEQLFMGVVRRAALLGLVEAPPEGPWSLKWQRVLDKVGSRCVVRSSLRSLAAWATARNIEPDLISEAAIKEWGLVFSVGANHDSIEAVRSALTATESCGPLPLTSRQERLALKASVGSVRDLSEVYGLRRRPSGHSRTKR